MKYRVCLKVGPGKGAAPPPEKGEEQEENNQHGNGNPNPRSESKKIDKTACCRSSHGGTSFHLPFALYTRYELPANPVWTNARLRKSGLLLRKEFRFITDFTSINR
jgi:hypothetical protein